MSDAPYELFHGDALQLLAGLPSCSVDALITDPPYSSGGMVRGDRAGSDPKAKYVTNGSSAKDLLESFGGDNRDQRSYAYWVTLWLGECLRVLKPGSVAMLFTDWRQLPATTDALQAGGFVWRGVVPWHKPTARPQAGRFTSSCEYVVWGSAGPMPTDYSAAVLPGFYRYHAPRDREHITQKPLELIRDLVKIVPTGGVVLDPFMGSGTTGVAALIEGRRFIGAEQSAHFFDVAKRRIERTTGEALSVGKQLTIAAADGDGEVSV